METGPTRDLAAELAAQSLRLEQTRREHEAALRKAREKAPASQKNPYGRGRAIAAEDVNIQEFLRHPKALRQAVIAREILGPPLGLTDGPDTPARVR
jgi:hypothetical protein